MSLFDLFDLTHSMFGVKPTFHYRISEQIFDGQDQMLISEWQSHQSEGENYSSQYCFC